MKELLKRSRLLLIICFLILSTFSNSYSQRDMIDSHKVEWEKIYSLVVEDKLPKLSEEEERKLLEEVDKVLTETKSLHSACNFLVGRVSDKSHRYLIFGNEKIKEKLLELFKMRRQCELKESVYRKGFREDIINRKDVSEEDKKKVLEWRERKKQLMTRSLNELVSKDGDKCLECYVHDPELRKLLTPPPGMEREFEPEAPYYDIEAFYSVALSTFLPGVYDYLWLSEYDIESLPYYPVYFYIIKIYPEEFISDISKGFIEGYGICRKEGECFRWEEVFEIFELMIKYNPSFATQKKSDIKNILYRYYGDFISKMERRKEEVLTKRYEIERKIDLSMYFDMLESVYRNELNIRKRMLTIYEQIGEREDIENIRRLGEGIDLDYPVRETNRAGDEKMKARYLQQVKELQERVNALVEKLSRQ